jgi:hypothetical protein
MRRILLEMDAVIRMVHVKPYLSKQNIYDRMDFILGLPTDERLTFQRKELRVFIDEKFFQMTPLKVRWRTSPDDDHPPA